MESTRCYAEANGVNLPLCPIMTTRKHQSFRFRALTSMLNSVGPGVLATGSGFGVWGFPKQGSLIMSSQVLHGPHRDCMVCFGGSSSNLGVCTAEIDLKAKTLERSSLVSKYTCV